MYIIIYTYVLFCCCPFSAHTANDPNKMHRKGIHLIKNKDYLCFCKFPETYICFWGHLWKYKPPGGLPETRPWFLETRISLKSQILKSVWLISFKDFLNPVSKSLSVALTFWGGSDDTVTKFIVYELYKDMWLFLEPHWNIEKIRRKLMFLRLCKVRSRDNNGGWVP